MEPFVSESPQRGTKILSTFFSSSADAAQQNRFLLVHPVSIMANGKQAGAAVLIRDDWVNQFVPQTGEYLSVGPARTSLLVTARIFAPSGIALFLEVEELQDSAENRGPLRIKSRIEGGWCPIWSDQIICGYLELDDSSMAFPKNSQSKPSTSARNLFAETIRKIE